MLKSEQREWSNSNIIVSFFLQSTVKLQQVKDSWPNKNKGKETLTYMS